MTESLAATMPNPIFCAIDTGDLEHARDLVSAVGPHVGGIKLGLEFWNAFGRKGVETIVDAFSGKSLFLDLKLHDIPNTVAGAVRALDGLPVDILTVHASGGEAMMRAARAAAPERTKVVAVTVLTSLSDEDLTALGTDGGVDAQVERLALLTRRAGLDGIVCSPQEVAARSAGWPDGLFVVPGIRPHGADMGDQKRALTPQEALDAGASVLVIGRPITKADNPGEAAEAIAAQVK